MLRHKDGLLTRSFCHASFCLLVEPQQLAGIRIRSPRRSKSDTLISPFALAGKSYAQIPLSSQPYLARRPPFPPSDLILHPPVSFVLGITLL